MLVDALCVAALADELRARLLGGRVQQVLQPHPTGLALEVYAGRRWYVELSADPSDEGIAFGASRPRRGGGPPTPLTLAARARLTGARLCAVEQPDLERILVLTFDAGTAHRLVAEVMGQLANLILVGDDDVVTACARRVTPDMTRARVVLPGRPYEPPPTPDKAPPDEATPDAVSGWLAEAGGQAPWRVLVRRVRGLSPMAAREVVARAAGDAASLSRALADLFALRVTGDWSPTIARSDGDVVAYAPYRISADAHPTLRIASVEAAASLAEAMAAYDASRRARDPYRDAREQVASEIATVREKLERRAAALARERWDPADVDALREAGDLILTHQTRIARGDTMLDVPGFEGGASRRIDLDPRRSAVENAQAYYERYRSRRRAIAAYDAREAEVEVALRALEQWAVDLMLAEDRPAIDAVHDALVEAGHVAGGRRSSAPSGRPLEVHSSDGLRILVGRNSRQNERVTFGLAARGDLWAHVRGAPGGHVVVKAAGADVPESTIREAAALAAHFSRSRADASVEVVVTEVRHVRRIRGGGPGLVTYDKERTLRVAPRAPEDIGAP